MLKNPIFKTYSEKIPILTPFFEKEIPILPLLERTKN